MRKVIILLMCITLILCSCQSNNNEEIYVENYEELIQVSEDIDFGDTSYNIETDSQNYFNFDKADYAATVDGYYSFWDSKIYFIDRESYRCLPLCSKADCSHGYNTQCDAYLDESVSDIRYYDGSLYTILREHQLESELGEYSLYRISLDGSLREKVLTMCSTTEGIIPKFTIHRGYVYYMYEDGESCCLVKCNIDGSEAQEICNVDSPGVFNNICGYGDGILFCYSLDSTKRFGYRILYYSQTGDELYAIADGVNFSFTAIENAIIYTDGSSMMKTSIDDLDTEVLVKDVSGLVKLSYDGKYVYVDNADVLFDFTDPANSDYTEHRIDVYDTEGELVDSVALEGQSGMADFGDKDCIFFSFDKGSGWQKCAFDKSQIGTENHEWTELEGLSR